MQKIIDLLNQFADGGFKDEALQDQAIAFCMQIIEAHYQTQPKLYKIYTSRSGIACRMVIEDHSVLRLTIEIYMTLFYRSVDFPFACHCLVFAEDQRIMLEKHQWGASILHLHYRMRDGEYRLESYWGSDEYKEWWDATVATRAEYDTLIREYDL